MPKRIPVAGIVTEYRRHSHADVIIGKILEGPMYDGKDLYELELVSLYCDQYPKDDMARTLAKKYSFRLSETIADALTHGKNELAVEGVLCIGEHGQYPKNKIGQILYPRKRFFDEVFATFEKAKKAVPVLHDKHFGPQWEDAKAMYDLAKKYRAPLLAGSTIPLTWRKPDLQLPMGCELRGAFMLGYGPPEGYGFHALEGLQCMVERRKGGEKGVRSVQALKGKEMWTAMEAGRFSQELLEATLGMVGYHARGDYKEICAKTPDASIWLIEYRDGFKAALGMLNGWVYESDGGSFYFAGQQKDKKEIVKTQFYLQQPDPFAHFGYFVKAFEKTIREQKSPIPAERTLLTSGILDAVMKSLHEGRLIETPHLEIAYEPVDHEYATGPIPKSIKR